jgi:hypothetical protein
MSTNHIKLHYTTTYTDETYFIAFFTDLIMKHSQSYQKSKFWNKLC